MPMNLDVPLPLLGGLSPSQFTRRHWQRKPLLVRAGALEWVGQLPRTDLFALAAQEGVESRLITHTAKGWRLQHGPFHRLPPMKQAQWTLLVQGVEAQLPAARKLMDAFRFVPEARLDDVMVSWASDGGGVGPHFDAYDVFLVQISGRRRWRIGRQKDLSLRDDLPLKILADFQPEQDWVLEPGDLLYLPPRWAHDGVALGADCVTASVGFRAPSMLELADQLLPRLLDPDDEPGGLDGRYTDAGASATDQPGRIPIELQAFAQRALQTAVSDPRRLARALGELLSEPKPHQIFEPQPGDGHSGVQLAPASRMLTDQWHVFLNGEAYRAAGRDAKLMQQLADTRQLVAPELAKLSDGARALVSDWLEWGWLWPKTS